ncbi:MAG: hypothetical protein V1688_05060 [bacterium]
MPREQINLESTMNTEPEKNEADVLVAERENLQKEVNRYFVPLDKAIERSNLISKMPREEVKPHYDKMLNRIFNETPALEEIEDTIGKDNLIRGIAQGEFPTEIEFNKGEELNSGQEDDKKLEYDGIYNPKTNKIKIGEEAPTEAEIWRELVLGWLPDVVKALDHEIIHYRYKNNISLLTKIKKKLNDFNYHITEKLYWGVFSMDAKDNFLKRISLFKEKMLEYYGNLLDEYLVELKSRKIKTETLAQKGDRVFKKEDYKTTSVIKDLVESYGYNKPEHIDQIIITSQAIDRLRALGMPDSDMAQELANAKYDSKSVSFPKIDKKIEQIAKKKGLEIEDVDTEVDLMRVKGEINMLKAAKIAQEELKDFCKGKIDNE